MMRTAVKLMLLFTVFACMLASSAAAQGGTTTQSTVSSKLKTYAWGRSPRPAKDPFWHQHITAAVDQTLAEKGMQRVELTDSPDAVMIYSATLEDDVFDMGWKGTLVLDLRNGDQTASLWRGKGSELFFDKSHKNTTKVEKVIAKILTKFPRTN